MVYRFFLHFQKTVQYIGMLAIVVLALGAATLYAAAPSGGYNPGDTLDPNCAPGDVDCTVSFPTSSGPTSATNGLSVFGGSIGMGGTLGQATTVDTNGFDFRLANGEFSLASGNDPLQLQPLTGDALLGVALSGDGSTTIDGLRPYAFVGKESSGSAMSLFGNFNLATNSRNGMLAFGVDVGIYSSDTNGSSSLDLRPLQTTLQTQDLYLNTPNIQMQSYTNGRDDSLGAPTYQLGPTVNTDNTGSPNDVVFGGSYLGNIATTYEVRIEADGVHFNWSDGLGNSGSAVPIIAGASMPLSYGVEVKFNSSTYVFKDRWESQIQTVYANGETPVNFLYTNSSGDLRSAPVSSVFTNNSLLSIDPSAGTMVIGSLADPVATVTIQLNNSGDTCVIDSTGLTCPSDENLKTDIVGIPNALDLVTKLDGVTYHWKTDTTASKKIPGFIAQDVEQIIPEAVVYNETTGRYAMNYTQIIPYLVEAIKQINTAVNLGTTTGAEIGELVVQRLRAHEVCLDDLCIDRDDLEKILNATGVDANTDALDAGDEEDAGADPDQGHDNGQANPVQPVETPENPQNTGDSQGQQETTPADDVTDDNGAAPLSPLPIVTLPNPEPASATEQ